MQAAPSTIDSAVPKQRAYPLSVNSFGSVDVAELGELPIENHDHAEVTMVTVLQASPVQRQRNEFTSAEFNVMTLLRWHPQKRKTWPATFGNALCLGTVATSRG